MNPRFWRNWRVWPLWAIWAACAARVVANWTRLPLTVVSNFSAAGAPNGWMPKLAFVGIDLAVLLVEVVIFSLVLPSARRPIEKVAVWLHAFAYAVTGVVAGAFWLAIDYNLGRRHASFGAIAWAALAGAGAGLILGLTRPRQKARAGLAPPPLTNALGVEVHRSRLIAAMAWAVAGVALAVAVVLWAAAAREAGTAHLLVPIALVPLAVALAMAYIAFLTGAGFRYVVYPTALRIQWGPKALGTVAAGDITSLAIEPIRPLAQFGGWGVRCRGADRAYIWKGRRAVRLTTREGRIFLGSGEPERLLGLLRQMEGLA